METMKCTSCGETVLSTDKFCKQCGKPNEQIAEQKSENSAEAEKTMNKKRKKLWISFWLGFVLLVGGLAIGNISTLLPILAGGFLVVFNGIKLKKLKKQSN